MAASPLAASGSLHEALHDAKARIVKLKADSSGWKEELSCRRDVVRLFWDIGNRSASVNEARHILGRAQAVGDSGAAARATFLVALLHTAQRQEAQAREVAAQGALMLGLSLPDGEKEPLVSLLARVGDAVTGSNAMQGELEQRLLQEMDPRIAEELQYPSLKPQLAELAVSGKVGSPFATKLRGFAAAPSSGSIGPMEWKQTMGRITLECPLPGSGWKESDIEVQVSSWQLQVRARGSLLESMCGEFGNDAIREGCWWRLFRQPAASEQQHLMVSVAKKAAMVWTSGPWNAAPLNPRRALSVAWTPEQKEEQALKGPENQLLAVKCGPPDVQEGAPGYEYASKEARMFAPKSPFFQFSPDDLCVGITAKQDRQTVTAEVHFDRFALDWVERQLPYEDLLACDVWDTGLYVFLVGDELNPFLWVEFAGQVIPEKSSWSVITTDTFRSRQRNPGDASPTLCIRCVKAPSSTGVWKAPFSWCGQTRLAFSDEEQMARFEPTIPGAVVLRRAGYDPEEPDFLEFVEELLADVTAQTGHMTAAQQAKLLREVVSRIHAEAGAFQQHAQLEGSKAPDAEAIASALQAGAEQE